MNTDLVLGFIGEDQPGIVRRLTQIVSHHDGNWLDSQMVQIGGFFSGVARIEVGADRIDALTADLQALEDLTVTIQSSIDGNEAGGGRYSPQYYWS